MRAASELDGWRIRPKPKSGAMIEVDLVAPILLTRAALPVSARERRRPGRQRYLGHRACAAPFYATYAGVKAGLAKFRRIASPRIEGRGRSRHDGLSGSDGYAHDELVACRPRTRLHPRASERGRRRL